jgi:hypothetical protein
VGDDVPVDSETLLMTDCVNLKIKPAQSFGCAYRSKVYVHVFEYSYVYEYLCTVSPKKSNANAKSLMLKNKKTFQKKIKKLTE